MKHFLEILFQGRDLNRQQAADAMDLLMAGQVPQMQVAAFLGALRGKGETVQEISGLADSMRRHAVALPIQRSDLIDTCGTGGDGAQTFNISTTCAFVVAAAGVGVVKHGNRSISSRCGSADVLEALKVPIDLSPEKVAASVDRLGFGFLFARTMHPSMGHVAPVRQALGVRTVFNLLGPLTNPAGARRQVIGIYDSSLLRTYAEVLRDLGSEEVMVVHGADGLDEVTLTAETHVAHLRAGGHIECYQLSPSDFDLPVCKTEQLRGGDARQNADILEGILRGQIKGAPRDIVLANVACALLVMNQVSDLKQGVRRAASLIDQGAAWEVLVKAREISP